MPRSSGYPDIYSVLSRRNFSTDTDYRALTVRIGITTVRGIDRPLDSSRIFARLAVDKNSPGARRGVISISTVNPQIIVVSYLKDGFVVFFSKGENSVSPSPISIGIGIIGYVAPKPIGEVDKVAIEIRQ